MPRQPKFPLSCIVLLAAALPAHPASAGPPWLEDRGPGVATSLLGTYVERGELLVYPFYEYTWNHDQEYKPEELGFAGNQDQRGRLIEHEALIFLSYGFTENVAVELESALYSNATLHKAPGDTSSVPRRLHESGFGDTQAELRWRLSKETAGRPELWSYSEAVFPFQKNRVLIGTHEWELIQGFGLTKGFAWGTVTTRASASYDPEVGDLQFGEYAIEYLRQISPKWRWIFAMEGEQDERALIAEGQWKISRGATLKLNNAWGLTSKAPDMAPEVGLALAF